MQGETTGTAKIRLLCKMKHGEQIKAEEPACKKQVSDQTNFFPEEADEQKK